MMKNLIAISIEHRRRLDVAEPVRIDRPDEAGQHALTAQAGS
jgi:hypothetical protein